MFQKAFLGIVMALAVGTQAFAAPGCKDVATTWTLSSTFVDGITASQIYSDGAGYTDGSQGVSASIKCGTDDAVLTVTSTRKIYFNFGAFLGTSSSNPPSWTSTGPFGSTPSNVKSCGGSPCTLLNIRNILDSGTANRDAYYILYTRLTTAFVAPDKNSYHLRMENPATSDVAPTPNDPTANLPYFSARVVVEHYPATSTTKEYWLVYPEPQNITSPSPENGVLLSNDATVNYGQFSMPFFIMIQVN